MVASVGERTVERLRVFSQRLAMAGGDVHATGLRVTTVSTCSECNGLCVVPVDDPLCPQLTNGSSMASCPGCSGIGCVRTVDDGSGERN